MAVSEKVGGEHFRGSRTQQFNKLGTLKKQFNQVETGFALQKELKEKLRTFLTVFLKHTETPCSENTVSIF